MNAVEFPSHPHPLNLKEFSSEEEENSRICGLCGETLVGSGYECCQCDFAAHLGCAENPPSVVIEESKIHEHTLTLLPTQVSFTCNACGLTGDRSPYVCLKCSFMTHKDCIEFPRVISINRHDHRMFYTSFLGPGKWTCGVCHQGMEGRYGAYSCHHCPNFATHSTCATRRDVWDGRELEMNPEGKDEENGEQLYFALDETLILHFSHKHHYLRHQDEHTDAAICCGCALPIATETFYRCQECDFFLHQRCALLPQHKTTFLHVHPLTLCSDDERLGGPNGLSRCHACELHFNGFSYRCLECDVEFDIRCSSVTEPFEVYCHDHPLFLDDVPTDEIENAKICIGCGLEGLKYVLSCLECNLHLCFACAVLPSMAKYKYDEHLLSIHTGLEDATGQYLCDVCEKKIEEMGNYYKCLSCGPVLHTSCAVGSFRHMRPWLSFISDGCEYKVVCNDWTPQLRCSNCHNDCYEPLLVMSTTTNTDDAIYLCSSRCFTAYVPV
ncbi:unnamed protein product [Eruca vesicaria subsp. sativa]|uniref:Phorbol-ester/DAG-type domain-containing protein n=1 Tax=Eruca vesicaria subsp. sativa TaxID=29727 RepID=A0ABC8JMY7_ERUVS|nr:unnamed protein product [Eruca vesicaria subsp. sativa]